MLENDLEVGTSFRRACLCPSPRRADIGCRRASVGSSREQANSYLLYDPLPHFLSWIEGGRGVGNWVQW